ncbi:MAG: hypothetical protein IPO90_05815 [Flavobacteriales bacterium]|nr:hypothetical protein [Flavobacteriales bacterium]
MKPGTELALAHDRIADNFGTYLIDSNIAHGEQALALAEQYGPDTLQVWIGSRLVEVLYAKGELWRSMQLAYRAEQYYLSLGDSVALIDMHNAMGNNLKRQGAWEQAIGYYRPNVRAAARFGKLDMQAFAYMNLGECYLVLNMLDSALRNEELAEALMARIGLNYQGTPFTLLGRIHARFGHRERALAYFRQGVVTTLAQRGEARELPQAYNGLANELKTQGRFDSAIFFAKKGYQLAARIPVILEEERGAALLADCYAQQGRLDSAYRYQKLLSDVKDSIEVNAGLIDARSLSAQVEAASDSLKSAAQLREVELKREVEVQRERTRRNIFLFAGLGVLAFSVVVFRQRNRIKKEHQRSEELLLNILPEEVAEELKAKGHADAKHFDNATILFTDFKGFTEASEKLSPQELVEELNTCFKAFDGIITARGIEKIKTIGDAYMCAGGLPVPASSTPAGVVQAALEMQAFMVARKKERDALGKPAFEMRVGIHTGPVVAGIVGVKKFAYDIWGDTVNTASRMESSGEVGQVNISEATYALVKNETGLTFTSRGKVQAKGKGEMEMYFVDKT